MNASLARVLPVLVALAILAALGWVAYQYWPDLAGRTGVSKKMSGTLIMEVPGPWVAPSGETVQGLVSYSFVDGDISYLLAPDDPLLGFMVPDAISPDGEKFAAVLPPYPEEDFESAIVVISFPLRQPILPVEPVTDVLAVSDFVWNPLGGTFAYSALTGAERPGLRIAPLFADQPDYGTDRPLAFSADGTMLLVREDLALAVMDVSDGFKTPVTGIADFASTPVESFAVSPDGAYLATHSFEGVRVYMLDWEGAMLRSVGFIEGAVAPVFSNAGQLMVRMPGGEGNAYALGQRLSPIGSTPLPEGAHLIRWISE